MMIWLLGALALIAALLVWRASSSDKAALPRIGDPLPAFELPDQSGALRTDREFRGRWLVLYFYPRDDTPGCTEQAAKVRDGMRSEEHTSELQSH